MLHYFDPTKREIIEEVVISACKTKLSQINQLLKAMSDYTNLTSLALCQTKLDKESVHYIADVANGNTKLRELDLSWNEVTSLSKIYKLHSFRHVGTYSEH